MERQLRFIHSADLHLDSLFKSKHGFPEPLLEQLRLSTFRAFDRLVEEAIINQVDFILLAGDLYDEEVRSLKAQVHLRNGFEKLRKNGIMVYLSYGNHDYLEGVRYPISFPENVHIFSSPEIEMHRFSKDNTPTAHIYGFSYEKRAVRERKVEQYVKQGEADLHIAMLHGSLETNTEHDVYAPFRLEEIYRKPFDYWALGHIHQRQTLSHAPPVVYPGNIQGRSKNETGVKGCYLVEWTNGEWSFDFLPLHTIRYERVSVSIDDLQKPQELETCLEKAKQKAASLGSPVMLSVEICSSSGRLHSWKSSGVVEEWIDIVNDAEDLDQDWIWIEEVDIQEQPLWNEEELKKGNHFIGEWLHHADALTEREIMDGLSPLYEHRKALRYLDELSEQEYEEIIQRAKRITMDMLLNHEDVSI